MLKELFSYMKQYKKYARISLACIAVECIFELVIPLIMADMVDVGIANGDQDYILHKGLVMIGCAGLALVLGICSARFCALCGQGFGANLREAEYRKLQSYSFSNIDHFQVSSLVTRLTSDVTVIQNSVSTGIRPLCRAPVMLFMATGSAFVINARLFFWWHCRCWDFCCLRSSATSDLCIQRCRPELTGSTVLCRKI